MASPIQYVINFSQDNGNGPLPSAGGFTYDAATKTFSDFEVVWNSATFDLAATANVGPFFNGPTGICGLASDASGSFQILSGVPCFRVWNGSIFFGGATFLFSALEPGVGTALINLNDPSQTSGTPTFADGPFSIAAVPEPSAGVLLALGFAALGVVARRLRSR